MGSNSSYIDNALFAELSESQKKLVLSNSVYFGPNYPLRRVIEEKGLVKTYKLELNPVQGHSDWIKMYSIASSSRLCLLYFLNKEGIEFEHTLTIAKGERVNVEAHYDAFDSLSNTYIECKCHEIAEPSHGDYLKEWAYRSILEDKLGLNNILVKNGCLFPTLDQFGVDIYPGNSIYQMHFDFKQLVTHVCGMIVQNKKGTIRYVFFTPTNCHVDKNVETIYKELKLEIEAIKKSKFLADLTKLGIKLEFTRVSFSEVKDLI